MADKPTLAVDFDDVVAGFNQAWSSYHNEHYGTNITYEGIHTFDMKALYGIDDTTLAARAWHFFETKHHTIEPVAGAEQALRHLAKAFDLHVVTSRCEGTSTQTMSFTFVHGLGAHFTDFHFTNGFVTRFPERRRSKLAVMDRIGATTIIEDAPGNALSLAEAGKLVLLPDRPWNRAMEPHPRIIRFKEWHEVPKLLLT